MTSRASGVGWRRVAAFITDCVGYLPMFFFAGLWYNRHSMSSVYYVYLQPKHQYVQDYLLLLALFFTQHFVFHAVFRSSFGQLLFGLTYVQADGARVSLRQTAVRSVAATALFPGLILAPWLLIGLTAASPDDIPAPSTADPAASPIAEGVRFFAVFLGAFALVYGLSLATDAQGRSLTERVVGWRLVRRGGGRERPSSPSRTP